MTSILPSFMITLFAMTGVGGAQPITAQGYVEAEYVLVSPQVPGALESVDVSRGDRIAKGTALFTLEHQAEALAVVQAEAEAAQKAAQLADLIKGKRQPELDALIAQRSQAAAAFQLAKINYDRDEKLLKSKSISQADWDARRATLDQTRGRLEEVEAALALGKQSQGRDDAIASAEAAVTAANAARAQAQWKLDQKRVLAPTDALVFDTLYRAGEYVPVGQGVVSLLPDANIKVRFFLTYAQLPAIKAGQAVEVIPARDLAPVKAHVNFISPKAEYTPPQLFNRDNRDRLIYMVEAKFDEPQKETLHPGQPVDVRFNPSDTGSHE